MSRFQDISNNRFTRTRDTNSFNREGSRSSFNNRGSFNRDSSNNKFRTNSRFNSSGGDRFNSSNRGRFNSSNNSAPLHLKTNNRWSRDNDRNDRNNSFTRRNPRRNANNSDEPIESKFKNIGSLQMGIDDIKCKPKQNKKKKKKKKHVNMYEEETDTKKHLKIMKNSKKYDLTEEDNTLLDSSIIDQYKYEVIEESEEEEEVEGEVNVEPTD